jgi:hypothetical protein
VAHGLPYDGTNPANTVCDNSGQVYTIGKRNSGDPEGTVGLPTVISYNNIDLGTIEIRHSRNCATVWARVRNTTGVTRQATATILLYPTSNGGVVDDYESTHTLDSGEAGWSDQYRDRPSFAAKGCIIYASAYRCATTFRTIAWAQYVSNWPNTSYACNHGSQPCERWPTLSNGLSVTRYYRIDGDLTAMPTSSGGFRDVSGDVIWAFN